MSSLVLQYAVVALAVLASAGFVANNRFPVAVRRLRIAIAVPLVRAGQARWLQRLGRWLAPAPLGGISACGGCNNCDPT